MGGFEKAAFLTAIDDLRRFLQCSYEHRIQTLEERLGNMSRVNWEGFKTSLFQEVTASEASGGGRFKDPEAFYRFVLARLDALLAD